MDGLNTVIQYYTHKFIQIIMIIPAHSKIHVTYYFLGIDHYPISEKLLRLAGENDQQKVHMKDVEVMLLSFTTRFGVSPSQS